MWFLFLKIHSSGKDWDYTSKCTENVILFQQRLNLVFIGTRSSSCYLYSRIFILLKFAFCKMNSWKFSKCCGNPAAHNWELYSSWGYEETLTLQNKQNFLDITGIKRRLFQFPLLSVTWSLVITEDCKC